MTTCQRCAADLDDYLDGRLEPGETTAVEEHVAGCPSCRLELEGLRSLHRRIQDLPASIDPDRDLWPGIAGRIGRGTVVDGAFGRRRRWWAVAAAAALLLAVGAGGFLLGRLGGGAQQGSPQLAPGAGPGLRQVRVDMPAATAAEEFARARAELIGALHARRHDLSEESLRVVEENLDIIDGAITRITRALQEDPDNPQLNRQLVMAYRQELSLLQRATQLPAAT